MPKESIKRADYHLPDPTDDVPWPKPYKVTGQSLDVHWGRSEELVQIHHVYYEDDGRKSVDRFIDLRRSEVNRLIKVLRSARDQSFGRDE